MDCTVYPTTPCRSRSILQTAIFSNQKLCTNLWQPPVTGERAGREVVNRWMSNQLQHQLYKEQWTLPDACTLLLDHTLSIHPLHHSCLWTRMQRRAARQIKATNSYKIQHKIILSFVWWDKNWPSYSDSDSLFTKFYNKESVSKVISIQTQAKNNTDIHQLATHLH